jgi:peptidoglycan/LPS O-acetylase OafA/YrhL
MRTEQDRNLWLDMARGLSALLVCLGHLRNVLRSLAFVLGVVIAWWLPNDVLYGFLVWMMGVAIYALQPWLRTLRSTAVSPIALSGLLLFLLSLAYSKSARLIDFIAVDPDFLVGLTFSILCLVLTYRPFPEVRFPLVANLARSLSEMSYSLYVSHFPIVVFIASVAYHSEKLIPGELVLTQFVGWSIVLIGLAFLAYWLFESRTFVVRNRLRRWTDTNGRQSQ